MHTTLPSLPKRVLLKGFDDEGRSSASAWLISHGVEVINLPSLADLIVSGPEADSSLLQKARTGGPKVLSWDQLRAAMTATYAANHRQSNSGTSEHGLVDSTLYEDVLVEGKPQTPIEKTETHLRILDLEIPLSKTPHESQWRIPGDAQFAHLCIDKPLLETLRAVSLGVLYGMPVALEGETAASKTSAVLYLAHLLEQPIVRLNLSGHTDAAELVGRYVPADGAAMINWSELTFDKPWLSAPSRKTLQIASSEKRPLSHTERLAIIGREQFAVNGWRFQEGYLPQAMRSGWWLLLDEMNLAETQVLERLNCALENPPGLVLTEGSGTVFGENGDVPVHKSFRMLATMNPSDYAGRAVLSQAFADRWGVWHQAAGPGEREIEQMLRFLVLGEHPRVVIAGRAYKAPNSAPVYSELQAIPKVEGLLQRVAVFHHSIFRASGGAGSTPSIGRLQKERYSFSRRILLNLLRYMCEKIRAGAPAEEVLISEAIQVLYLARMRDDADRRAVNNMLRAGGLL